MTRNMGTIDRAVRIVAAVTLLFIAFGTGFAASGVLHWGAIVIAGVLAITAVLGNCPLYSVIGLKACRKC